MALKCGSALGRKKDMRQFGIFIILTAAIGVMAGCAPEHREEVSIEPGSVPEIILSTFRFLRQRM